jgi:hypothetical protein
LAGENEMLEARLANEYKIVQDKIDKIGAFRFTVRGWTVTLLTGAILGIFSTKLSSPYIPLFLLIPLWVFASIEAKQNRNQQVLEDRAYDIEAELRRLLAMSVETRSSPIESPIIAHSLKEARRPQVGVIRDFISDADQRFYWILSILVLLAFGLSIFTKPITPSSEKENINIMNAPVSLPGAEDQNIGKPNNSQPKQKPR